MIYLKVKKNQICIVQVYERKNNDTSKNDQVTGTCRSLNQSAMLAELLSS